MAMCGCGGGSLADMDITVMGAGVAECNGTYTPNGSWDGEPQWINSAGVELWRGETEWRMGRPQDFYYVGGAGTNGMDADTFMKSGSWIQCENGRPQRNSATCDPVPRTVPSCCKCPQCCKTICPCL